MADRKRVPQAGGVKAHPRPETDKKRIVIHEPVHEEKIDRNAPCPCGSGKKYKKCCAESSGLFAWLRSLFRKAPAGKGDSGEQGS